VVFDTNTVVSALLFANGRLAWLRTRWRDGSCIPLTSKAAAAELNRVLSYPKFQLSQEDRFELLADYLPYCELVEVATKCPVICRDIKDQHFLDLALSGGAHFLVSGDQDLLVLAGQTAFLIETPEAYRSRFFDAIQNP
jgi:putative PIN family toxin of toxin-antitoxin system